MTPPTRLDPRTVLLVAAVLLATLALAPPLDARPGVPAGTADANPAVPADPAASASPPLSTNPAASAHPTQATHPTVSATPADPAVDPAPSASPSPAPSVGDGDTDLDPAPPGWIPPGIAPAAAGWRSPIGAPVTVVRGFTPPATPYGPGHRGVDLLAPPGTAIRAAGDGLVTYAGPLAGRGVVVVSHGSLRTTYEPLTAAVTLGQRVAAGEVIGHAEAGHPGCPDGCLHWGLLRGDAYLDPLSLLRLARPRLLPLGDPTDRPAGAGSGNGYR